MDNYVLPCMPSFSFKVKSKTFRKKKILKINVSKKFDWKKLTSSDTQDLITLGEQTKNVISC